MSLFIPKSDNTTTETCKECEGKGYILCSFCDGTGCEFPQAKVGYCDHCSGKGKFLCNKCKGIGFFVIKK